MTGFKVKDALEFLDGAGIPYNFEGKEERLITGFSALNEYESDSITWVKTEEYLCDTKSRIALCVTRDTVKVEADAVIYIDDPKAGFFAILTKFFSTAENEVGVAVDSTVLTEKIGKNVSIGHHCFISKECVIGNDVTIRNNVCLENKVIIGENTFIADGVVIGTDGYGYFTDKEGTYKKVPHFGGVVIGRDVEIGANTCIDRGTMGDTVIGDNVKIDNLCHIGHNVHIDENAMIIAFSMLGGSSHVEKNGYMAPGALLMNQKTVHENAQAGMGAVVIHDVEPGMVVVGNPAKSIGQRK